MIDLIAEVRVEPFNRTMGGSTMLKGSATIVYDQITMTVPLSTQTLATIEECVERDVDTAIGKMNL